MRPEPSFRHPLIFSFQPLAQAADDVRCVPAIATLSAASMSLCIFVTEGSQPCPFGCTKKWTMCHPFLENTCPDEQWEYCRNGWHTTEANLKAKNDRRNIPKEDHSSKPSSERVTGTATRRGTRSRSTDRKQNRKLSGEESKRTVRCQEWQLDPTLQIAMVKLGIYSLVLPNATEADEAVERALRDAPSEAVRSKVKVAFQYVRETIATHTQSSSSSKDPPSCWQ